MAAQHGEQASVYLDPIKFLTSKYFKGTSLHVRHGYWRYEEPLNFVLIDLHYSKSKARAWAEGVEFENDDYC